MSDLIGEAWTHTGYAQRLHFGAGVVARLPEIVKELSGEAVAPIADDEYDNVYVVTVPTFGNASVLRMKY